MRVSPASVDRPRGVITTSLHSVLASFREFIRHCTRCQSNLSGDTGLELTAHHYRVSIPFKREGESERYMTQYFGWGPQDPFLVPSTGKALPNAKYAKMVANTPSFLFPS